MALNYSRPVDHGQGRVQGLSRQLPCSWDRPFTFIPLLQKWTSLSSRWPLKLLSRLSASIWDGRQVRQARQARVNWLVATRRKHNDRQRNRHDQL